MRAGSRNLRDSAMTQMGHSAHCQRAARADNLERTTMLAGTASHHSVVRAAALMGAVLLSLSFASAERHFLPGLKDATRGVVPVVRTGPNRWRGRAKVGAGQAAGGPGVV